MIRKVDDESTQPGLSADAMSGTSNTMPETNDADAGASFMSEWRRLMRVFAAFCLTVLLSIAAPAGAQPIDVRGRLELFIDDSLIEKLEGAAQLTLQKPQMRGIVIVHDKPWEGNTCAYHTIFRDGEKVRMYYRGSHSENGKPVHPEFTCYAESEDGIRWSKPSLGLMEFDGSKDNNIIWRGPLAHNFCPFLDANPACPAEEKYKALAGTPKIGGLHLLKSADGTHWDQVTSEPLLATKDFAFDSQNLAFWDTERAEYRVYFRNWKSGHPKGIRSIQTAVSKDLRNWSTPVWLEFPGVPDEQLYTNAILPYAPAPHLFLGFPSRIIEPRGDLVEGLFMTSRDGKTFLRRQEAIIRPGRNRDRWHNRSNYIWLGMVETASDLPGGGTELSIYSGENYYKGEGVRVRRYTYRPDGFVSVNAPYSGGSLLTKPLAFTGGKLMLNIATSAAGSVRVELQDAEGSPYPGYTLDDCEEIFGDDTRRVVKWKQSESVKSLEGKPVRLRLELKDADVFSFRFADEQMPPR